ncbi:monovalent cation/H(+) antiporter subunit G [Alkalihalobacillus trypoxylicola]|uniref:monovalent cation/H(+) antiporter subunit G n=1 Tax=Alkalihalobacillus trypoxylicola TaxID=519424 RepID=UPI0007DC1FE8|nr:monovalent cation/H(+) antiporter subunit G [Alkalihalobacillus trypoxylicola]
MNGNVIIDVAVGIFVVIGALISFITMIGLIRLPDTYTRAHAASKSATLGVLLILIATLIFFYPVYGFDARIILGIIFVFISSPVAGHLISRAAYFSGIPQWENAVRDDLKEVLEKRKERYLKQLERKKGAEGEKLKALADRKREENSNREL